MHNIYAHDDADDCADKHDNKEANYERVHKDDNGDADKENGKDEDVNGTDDAYAVEDKDKDKDAYVDHADEGDSLVQITTIMLRLTAMIWTKDLWQRRRCI